MTPEHRPGADPDIHPADGSIVFVHAHPDDEAIFTGGTLRLLADAGWRTVVVLATADEVRAEEARTACELLGVGAVYFLGFDDSGLDGAGQRPNGRPFAAVGPDEAVQPLAELLREERAVAVVLYDDGGIYGHPDHIAVHRIGSLAAEIAGVSTVYESTVDREYLHFVETHLVGRAVESLLGVEVAATNTAPLGVPTVMVDVTIDVRQACAVKRAAMAAHVSQIPAGAEALTMDVEVFAGVYGFEWYMRTSGPRGPLESFAF